MLIEMNFQSNKLPILTLLTTTGPFLFQALIGNVVKKKCVLHINCGILNVELIKTLHSRGGSSGGSGGARAPPIARKPMKPPLSLSYKFEEEE